MVLLFNNPVPHVGVISFRSDDRRYMGAPTGVDAEAMRLQNEEFKKENEELRSKLQSLTEKVNVTQRSFVTDFSKYANYWIMRKKLLMVSVCVPPAW